MTDDPRADTRRHDDQADDVTGPPASPATAAAGIAAARALLAAARHADPAPIRRRAELVHPAADDLDAIVRRWRNERLGREPDLDVTLGDATLALRPDDP